MGAKQKPQLNVSWREGEKEEGNKVRASQVQVTPHSLLV